MSATDVVAVPAYDPKLRPEIVTETPPDMGDWPVTCDTTGPSYVNCPKEREANVPETDPTVKATGRFSDEAPWPSSDVGHVTVVSDVQAVVRQSAADKMLRVGEKS